MKPELQEALRESVERDFVRRAATLVRAHFPVAAALGEDELTTRVRSILSRARALGFVSERHVSKFVAIDMALGPGFEASGWAAEAMAAADPDVQMLRLQAAALAALG